MLPWLVKDLWVFLVYRADDNCRTLVGWEVDYINVEVLERLVYSWEVMVGVVVSSWFRWQARLFFESHQGPQEGLRDRGSGVVLSGGGS